MNMDQKRRIFVTYCTIISIALLCMIMMIYFIVEHNSDSSASNIDNNESLSHVAYNMNHHYGSNVDDDIPESRWNMNVVKHHQQHDKFQFSNGMYFGKNDENYLIIDDVNISQIDRDKRDKVKEVIFYERHFLMRVILVDVHFCYF